MANQKIKVVSEVASGVVKTGTVVVTGFDTLHESTVTTIEHIQERTTKNRKTSIAALVIDVALVGGLTGLAVSLANKVDKKGKKA